MVLRFASAFGFVPVAFVEDVPVVEDRYPLLFFFRLRFRCGGFGIVPPRVRISFCLFGLLRLGCSKPTLLSGDRPVE